MDVVANLSSRQKTIAGLTVATAVIHFVLAFIFGGSFLILFVLNGLGYLALLAALYFLPQMAGQRAMVRWALLGFYGRYLHSLFCDELARHLGASRHC